MIKIKVFYGKSYEICENCAQEYITVHNIKNILKMHTTDIATYFTITIMYSDENVSINNDKI